MKSDRLIVIGKALKPIGLNGELKIYPYTESLDIFKKFPYLFFETELFEVTRVRKYKALIGVYLKGINNYEDAHKLRDKLVKIPQSFFPRNEDDEYYWFELIGATVFNIQGKSLGTVQSLIRTSAHDILQVRAKTKELLIPFIDDIVKTVNLKENHIIVDLLTGMNPDD